MILAWLGDIPLELPAWPVGLERELGHSFAAHEVVDGRPKLQSTGKGLVKIKLSGRLAARFGDPGAFLGVLRAAVDDGLVLPLVFASGEYPGSFVIEKMDERLVQADHDGTVWQAEVDLELTMYIGDAGAQTTPGVV